MNSSTDGDENEDTLDKAVSDGSNAILDADAPDSRAREAMERYQAYITGYRVWIKGFNPPQA